MTFTVDTHRRLITIASSVKYEEVKELREKFPSEFIDNYTWLVPLELIEHTTIGELVGVPKQITQPEYPVANLEDPRDCGCACGCGPRNEDC